jgi:hypothetical protein
MKKIIFFIGTILVLSSCVKSGKYKITDSSGRSHSTDQYTKTSDGCIKFQEICGCGEDSKQDVVLCGSYSITENLEYQPQ